LRQEKTSSTARWLALFIFLIAIYLVIITIIYLFRTNIPFDQLNLLIKPAAFLFISFSAGAFYIPAFLIICAYLLITRPFLHMHLKILNLSIIPFLTFSLLLKLMSVNNQPNLPLTRLILETLGRIPGCMLLFILFAAEVLALTMLATKRTAPEHKIRYSRTPSYTPPSGNKREFILEVNRFQRRQREEPLGTTNVQSNSARQPVKTTQPPTIKKPLVVSRELPMVPKRLAIEQPKALH